MSAADHVDADDPEVAAILRETVQLVERAGGHLDPGVTLVERDHDLHLEVRNPDSEGGERIVVPERVLVPEEAWTDPDAVRELEPDTRRAHELVDQLFRHCRKIERFAPLSPRVAASSDPDLVTALASTRAQPAESIPVDPVRAFLGSRAIHVRRAEPPAGRIGVLMPVVDLANHHPDAEQFSISRGALSITARPTGVWPEFAVRYAWSRDALDLAIWFGFLHEGTRTANCVPVRIELPHDLVLQVDGRRPRQQRPPSIRPIDDGIAIADVQFRDDGASASETYLGMAVTAMLVERGTSAQEAGTTAARVVEQVVDRNVEIYSAVADVAAAGGSPAHQLVADAARLNVAVLSNRR